MRGSRYHGYAAKKHKGSGNKGGKGMAGTGKRAGQKRTYVLKYHHPYLGKKKKKGRKKRKQINVCEIQKNYKPGEILLEGHKVLGKGNIKDKFIIKADSFSKSAKEKIEKAGGKAIELKPRFEKESKGKEEN